MTEDTRCVLCAGVAGDTELFRVQVWEDALWRLSTTLFGAVPGFSYLEPKRHVPHIEDLDGLEAETLGPVLAHMTRELKFATGAERVFVYVFGGGVPHLHLHLAPHRTDDALNTQMVRGEVEVRQLASGATMYVGKDFPPLAETELRQTAESIRTRLAGWTAVHNERTTRAVDMTVR
jgi:diadenosine tetraphosphate (Ap4A) HIT family hydrolase